MNWPTEIKGRKLVKGEGPKRPRLILVGESLGAEEEANGRPFVGTDGQILDGILSSARINRSDCYITNVVKVRPPNNKVERLGEYGLSIEDFVPMLKEELSGIECDTIVPLGDLALNVVCQKDGITKHRGSIYRQDRYIVPTYNPGFVREFWQSRGTVVEDLKKALRVAKDGYVPVEFSTLLRPSLIDIEYFIELCKAFGLFTFDIETIGSFISCIGLGTIASGKRVSICIPLKHGLNNYWTQSDELYIWSLLRQLFQSSALKIAQNITFDLTFLAPFIGEPSPPWYDLMVAHHTIDPELPHSLAYMTSIYTDVPYYKDDPKDKDEGWSLKTPSEVLWEYNGKDCEVPLIIEPILTSEMKELRVLDFFRGFAMPLVTVMFRMQRRGLKIDTTMQERLLTERVAKANMRQQELNAMVGYELNVNSSKQMLKFLYEDLKLPIHKNRKTGRATANKETLEKLFAKHPDPRFKQVMELRDLTKDIGYLPSSRAR
jgi:uracil-DNA glycosylase family 4